MAQLDISNSIYAGEVPEQYKLIASPFLVPFCNFFYYLTIIPFKTVFDVNKNKYILKTILLQQIACGITHTGAVFILNFITWDEIFKIKSDDVSSIVVIFELGSNFGASMAALCLIYIVWRRRNDYLHIINSTCFKFANHKQLKASHMLIYTILGAVLAFFGFIDWFIVHEKSFDNNSFKVTNATDQGYANLFFVHIVVLYVILFFIVCQATFLAIVLTFMKMGKEFSLDINSDCLGNDGVAKGIVKYRNLKVVIDKVRCVYGNALLGFHVSAIANYALAPHVLLGTRGEAERIVMIYLAFGGVIWLIAAEFHYDVRSSILKWVEYHIDRDDLTYENRLRLYAISAETSSSDVIALSSKWFSVTYKYLGSMLGLVVTYGIIVFQLHPNQKS